MSALERVRGGGRGLDRRLDSVPAQALLSGLRAAGAVSEPEVAALGRPGGSGWARRLRALATAKGDWTCQILLCVLEGLEGPPRPGPFDFYNPQRDSAPSHHSDCPCCRPDTEWTHHGHPKNEEENPKNEGENPKNEEENPEDDEENPKNEDEGPEDDEGGGDEGPEDDEDPKNEEENLEDEEENPKNEDEGPEDDEGGDEGPEDDEGGDEGDEGGDEGDEGGGDEGGDEGDEGGGDED